MKKQRIFAVVMAAVMTLSMVACGEKTGNDVTPTPAPTATTAPTEAPADPTATPVPVPQNVTIADASITFEDGNMGFADAYMQHARSANLELSIADFNGSKALKAVNTTGTSKAPFVAIDVSSLFGADVSKIAGVEMVVGTSHDDGEFHAVSGKVYSWWGAEQEEAQLGKWSVYMAKKNPAIVSGKVAAGNELVPDAFNIIYVSVETDNGATDAGIPATLYIDDIRFFDAAGNTLKPADTTVAFNWPEIDEVDLSIKALANAVEFDGYGCSGGGWGQNGADFTQELLDALQPGTALEIDFQSADGTMWAVFPDAAAGWSRIAQGEATINDGKSKAQITYEQIVAVVGEDKANWGARLQFEAVTDWEVYGIRVGTPTANVAMANPVAFDGFVTSGGGWGQNGAEMPQELIDAINPGTAVKVSYKSGDGSMWLVFPDATAGWSRIAQGTAVCDGSVAYITYDQIVEVVGEDKTQWGARMQFEAVTDWEVYGIEVGQFVKYPVMNSFVAFDGYTTSGGAWGQNGADFTADLLAALTPGSIIEIAYKSGDGSMWVVLPDAAAGWSRCAQGTAICDGSKAYVTYEQIAAVVGDDQANWGARLQFEAATDWEVYGIRVGKYVAEAGADEGGEEEAPAQVEDPLLQTADGTVAYTSSKTWADTAWWTQLSMPKEEIIGTVNPEEITAIKFTADTAFVLGYKDVNGNWIQTENVEGERVIKTMELGDAWDMALALSKGDGVEYTVTWEVYTGGDKTVVYPEAPAEPEAPAIADPVITAADGKGTVVAADASWWTQIPLTKEELLAGVAEADVTGYKFTGDTDFIIAYNDATPTWIQKDAASSFELTAADINMGGDYYFCFVLSKGDSVVYNLAWEVLTAGGAAAEEPAGDNLVITFADLTAGGYGYEATVNGDAVDVTIASQYQEIQYILPEAVDLAAYKTLIVDVTSNAQLDIKLVDPNAELNEYSQKAPFRDNYTAEGQAITEPVYIDLAEYADKDLAQINFMAMGNDVVFTIKSITFVK